MQNCDHLQSTMRDLPTGGRVLRICEGCMRELDAQFRVLAVDLCLDLDQINRIIVQPRTRPQWIERTEGDLALVGAESGKSESVESRDLRSRGDRLNLSEEDREFLYALGVAIDSKLSQSS
jgi:hypothetical protein